MKEKAIIRRTGALVLTGLLVFGGFFTEKKIARAEKLEYAIPPHIKSVVGDNTEDVSYAIGLLGKPVIAYANYTSGLAKLYITKCGDAACSSGNITTQISTGEPDNGRYNDIVVPADGKPVVVFESGSSYSRSVYLVKCGNESCSSGNTLQHVEFVSMSPPAYQFPRQDIAVALASDGYPILAYARRDILNGYQLGVQVRVAKCANATCSSKTISTPESWNTGSLDVTNFSIDLAVGSDGNPMLAYHEHVWAYGPPTLSNVIALKCGDALCGANNVKTTLDSWQSDMSFDLKPVILLSGGSPVITYNRYDPFSVSTLRGTKQIACGNTSCTSGNSAPLDPASPVSPPPSASSGSYNSSQNISLPISTGSFAYYTLNGLDPTNASTLYTGPIALPVVDGSAITVKWVVYDAFGNRGATGSATYIFDTTPPPAPAVNTPASPVNADSILVEGSAEASSTITITGGATPATGTATNGNFSISVNLTQNAV
ncbi:MAG: chitobiase/beta-hexosaminidase C-terminal domain-containing protein, partial [Patescibacteria group bacterium]